MIMETEFEAKFYPVDKEKIRKALKKLGAKLIKPERKMRRAIASNRVYPQLKCDYLRVRDEGDNTRFSIKICGTEKGQVSDQKELDVLVSDFDKMVEMMDFLGFKPTKYQENLRETWDYKGVEIVIDTWPGLKPYVKIEAESEKTVKEIAEKLGFKWEDKIVTAVQEIFAKVYNMDVEEALRRLDHITFGEIPF